MEQHIRLAQQLPPRLLDFFRKFPPPQLASIATAAQSTPKGTDSITIAENTSSSDPNVGASTTEIHLDSRTLPYSNFGALATPPPLDSQTAPYRNPFLPFKNPRTGNWHGPRFSLRRQADLFKLASQHNVLPLMPLSSKHPEVREQKRIENGLRVQGTGIGKKVKGKLWERTLRGKLEERRKAMEGMPALIRHWKERGHGRGWKKWPK